MGALLDEDISLFTLPLKWSRQTLPLILTTKDAEMQVTEITCTYPCTANGAIASPVVSMNHRTYYNNTPLQCSCS